MISDVKLYFNGLELIGYVTEEVGACYATKFYKTIVVVDLTNVSDAKSVWCELTSTKSRLIIVV